MESFLLMGWYVYVCSYLLFFHSNSLCDSHDSFALLQFKSSVTINTTIYVRPFIVDYYPYVACDDVYYPKIETWKNGTDCCSWLGVTCHPISGHVIMLDLSCSGLYGKIHPNNTLFRLSHLQSLNLAFNYFSNSRLSSLFDGFASIMHLNMSCTHLRGEIPSQISHLSKLQSLDLSYNYQLKWKESSWKKLLQNATLLRELILDESDMSSISLRPLNLSSSLVTLSLLNTGLRGKLTNDVFCLPNLQELHMSNYLQDQQLPNFSCSVVSLSILDLSDNYFQGSIPSSFSNLTRITFLDLSNNNLNNSIPSSLFNFSHLTSLFLNDNNFSGQIPNISHKSNTLEELDLSNNNIRGELLSTLSNLQLSYLDLSSNELSGQIPSSLFDLTQLSYLDLSSNELSGQIPSSLFDLSQLSNLDLSSNKLSGQIPSSLFDLTQLSYLDLSYNNLEGPLPNKITGLSNLTALFLHDNLVNGTIPSWCLSLQSLLNLDLSYNYFTGPLTTISSYSLETLNLDNNKLHGDIPESISNLVNITYLLLSSNSFSGFVKFSLLFELPNLRFLDLSKNTQISLNCESNANYTLSRLWALDLSHIDLTEFPKLSGQVPDLRFLDMSNNKLGGRVPNWLFEISSLTRLDLSQNLLTISLDQLSRHWSISYIDLSYNSLKGGIPSSICNASLIEFLNLSHNKLTGTIPQCLTNISNLQVLDLQMNNLYGTLPSTFTKRKGLGTLNLNGNQLQGILPKSLSNCTNLEVLNLSGNQFEDTFPYWLHGLRSLRVLVLKDNKLHGTLNNFETNYSFRSLIIFDISSNNFSGPIPKVLIQNFETMKNVVQGKVDSSLQLYIEKNFHFLRDGIFDSVTVTTKAVSMTYNKIPTNLIYIDFSRNKFEGEIPNVFGELLALKGLNLSHNKLSGHIPQSMGDLTNLESLDLSSNMLNGRIPAEFAGLKFLEVLNLSHNHLVGEIPQGKQFDTFSNDSYEGNSGLCGAPLSVKCNKDSERHSPSSPTLWERERSGFGFRFGWKPVVIGYGFGILFGMGLECCVFY